ncbi:MAG: S-adenosylmethionine:tRNA ribosyltransferase-isomerase [Flavobacteriales bacterium]|nr:MAG: S-adenosylmethionine:tRNA ribosyltransferase-isomerase [Flavobacteriales bacterium]
MHPREIRIAEYTYQLPEERIAQAPLPDRDASKLLVLREGRITDRLFRDLSDELPPGALLVLNETKVVHARLVFHRPTGARIEVLCLSPRDGIPVESALAQKSISEWQCFIGNAKRWKEGEVLRLQANGIELSAERVDQEVVRFHWSGTITFAEVLLKVGHVPLPPYMKRADEPDDRERYNTVFARNEGSVAAPTASLHFTPEVLGSLQRKYIGLARLTLHVGAGTFLPVKSERMDGHAMHAEEVRIPLGALEQVRAQMGKAPIVVVGTTALRTLESVYWHGVELMNGKRTDAMDVPQWAPYTDEAYLPTASEALDAVIAQLKANGGSTLTGRTQILIAPGYHFRFADALVTNFHQPQSTLILLVAAFVGEQWRTVYTHAMAHGYRFLSYGDGSLLWRNRG